MRMIPEDRALLFMREHGLIELETLKNLSDLIRQAEDDALDEAAALFPDINTRLPILALKHGV